METFSLVSYATAMDPNNARKLGLVGTPEPVVLEGYQRFFGYPNAALLGITLNDIINDDGSLRVTDIGATTVMESPSHSCNAVVYNNVPFQVIHELCRTGGDYTLVMKLIELGYVRHFLRQHRWEGDHPDASLFMHRPTKHADFPGIGSIPLVREDVTPHRAYLKMCRAAARTHGAVFGRAYEETTFLADRKTRLSESGF